jgi:hypothetical protein
VGRNSPQCDPIEQQQHRLGGGQVQHLGVSDDLSSRRTRVEHECVTKPFRFVEKTRGVRKTKLGAVLCDTSGEAHSLLFPIADGDDAFTFAVPLEVISG